MDEDSRRPRYVERIGGGLHPVVDKKRLNMIYTGVYMDRPEGDYEKQRVKNRLL